MLLQFGVIFTAFFGRIESRAWIGGSLSVCRHVNSEMKRNSTTTKCTKCICRSAASDFLYKKSSVRKQPEQQTTVNFQLDACASNHPFRRALFPAPIHFQPKHKGGRPLPQKPPGIDQARHNPTGSTALPRSSAAAARGKKFGNPKGTEQLGRNDECPCT